MRNQPDSFQPALQRYTDQWKEDFLKDIENHAVIELYQNQSYKLIGMPFYNKENREDIFEERLKNI